MTAGDSERETVDIDGRRIVLIDSITQVRPGDAGAIVVSGSHGGVSSGRYAAAVRAALYAFNDAGVGKGGAGIAALANLDALGIAAVAVSHETAVIGDAHDAWENGVVAHANDAALVIGVVVRDPLRDVVSRLAGQA